MSLLHLSYNTYLSLLTEFQNTLFIFIIKQRVILKSCVRFVRNNYNWMLRFHTELLIKIYSIVESSATLMFLHFIINQYLNFVTTSCAIKLPKQHTYRCWSHVQKSHQNYKEVKWNLSPDRTHVMAACHNDSCQKLPRNLRAFGIQKLAPNNDRYVIIFWVKWNCCVVEISALNRFCRYEKWSEQRNIHLRFIENCVVTIVIVVTLVRLQKWIRVITVKT